jgi:hypothetical protein
MKAFSTCVMMAHCDAEATQTAAEPEKNASLLDGFSRNDAPVKKTFWSEEAARMPSIFQ